MQRRSLLAVVVAVILALLLSSAGGAADPSSPSQSSHRLPSRFWPEKLLLAADGSLWMTGKYWGIARLDAKGQLTVYRSTLGDEVDALVNGPDGAVWFAGDQAAGRIDRGGHRETWATDDYGIARAITVADDSVWYAASSHAARIVQVGAEGVSKTFVIKGPRSAPDIEGIAEGADGALWFTEQGYTAPDAIGRMTVGGRYWSRRLPGHPGPGQIVAGPDGALWFTEQNAYAIGRITTNGLITEFPLRTGMTAHDIAPGPDGALWFTTDSCIGRVTTSGQVTTWSVAGAVGLDGIVAAPDGSFWLADTDVNTIRHFTPPADDAAPAAQCGPRSVTVSKRSTVVTVTYQLQDRFGKVDYFTDPRIRITRAGIPAFREAVPRYPIGGSGGGPDDVFGSTGAITVRDLDGDREPEVMLTLNLGGAHCCSWSRVYRYDAARNRYLPSNHFWGDDAATPRLEDLNGDRKPEFVSVDARFAYAFTSYAGSVMPIQIWTYDAGKFRNVTRRFPNQIRRDANRIWRLYLKYRKTDARGILPAWAADEYMLGRASEVDGALAEAARTKTLTTGCGDSGCAGDGPNGTGYLHELRAFLRAQGYLVG